MNKKQNIMRDLLKQTQNSLLLPRKGDLIEGVVLKIGNTEMLIDLGPLGTGAIYGAELKENRNIIRELKLGDKISALVIDAENDDGYVELSLKQAGLEKTWNEVLAKKQNNESVVVKITEANRGGLVIEFMGIIGFLPVSQLAPNHYPVLKDGDKNKIAQHLNQFVGQTMEVKIITADKQTDKLIVSEKINQQQPAASGDSNKEKPAVPADQLTREIPA